MTYDPYYYHKEVRREGLSYGRDQSLVLLALLYNADCFIIMYDVMGLYSAGGKCILHVTMAKKVFFLRLCDAGMRST